MIVNPSKTEFVVFHPSRLQAVWRDPLQIDNCKIFPTKNLKILGIHFSSKLDWDQHVNTAINKANSLIYALGSLGQNLLLSYMCISLVS